MLELFHKDNILESLNNIDARTNNKYDLVNLYSSKNLTSKQINSLSEMLESKESSEKIYKFLDGAEEVVSVVHQKEFENLLMDLNEYLRAEGIRTFAYQVDTDKFEIEVIWGDWKHDHLFLQVKVNNFFKDRGYEITHESEVTEEDGSDTYSAIHTFEVVGKTSNQ